MNKVDERTKNNNKIITLVQNSYIKRRFDKILFRKIKY